MGLNRAGARSYRNKLRSPLALPTHLRKNLLNLRENAPPGWKIVENRKKSSKTVHLSLNLRENPRGGDGRKVFWRIVAPFGIFLLTLWRCVDWALSDYN